MMEEELRLEPMTEERYHTFFREYRNDPALYLHPEEYREYRYTHETVEAYIRRQRERGRIALAVMLGDHVIGEVKFYDIVPGESAWMGIALQNDSRTDRGYGTRAERMAIRYAFEVMELPVLYADAVLTNLRSRHVLEKAGFRETRTDGERAYYEIRRE